MSVLSLYIIFWVDSFINRDKRLYIAGNNNHNLIIFSPWVLLLIVIVIAIIIKKTKTSSQLLNSFLPLVIGIGLTVGVLLYAMPPKLFISSVIDLFMKKQAPLLFLYLLVCMISGLILANAL